MTNNDQRRVDLKRRQILMVEMVSYVPEEPSFLIFAGISEAKRRCHYIHYGVGGLSWI